VTLSYADLFLGQLGLQALCTSNSISRTGKIAPNHTTISCWNQWNV